MLQEERILDLIKRYPYLARKKKSLINAIWLQDMDNLNLPKPYTYSDFMEAYKADKITDAENIGRCLRKILEENPALDPQRTARKRVGVPKAVTQIRQWNNQ